ncbi:MAG: aminopeptidase, partial [Thermoleophilaceae bacterium]|nr:aminopeptidase [Thermoleophilaceae bacterium]
MKDPRIDALAQILVRYSTNVGPGDVTVIQSTTIAEPLVQAVYEEVLRAGGHPVFQITPTGAQASFYELANDDQLDFVAPPQRWTYTDSDVRIAIMAEANTRALSRSDPAKQARAQKARKPLLESAMKRSAEGSHRWALTLFPTEAFAAEADMSLAQYEEFFYRACLAYDDDP